MSKILLVDNSAFMRKIIANTLKSNGYQELYEAESGDDAVKKYEQVHPDLVILDIVMCKMDGLGALKAIRAKDDTANIVMCSAMGQERYVMDAIGGGARDFIVKPFTPSRLMKTVSTILGNG